MKTVFLTLAGLTTLFAATLPEAPDAAALLKRSDGYRNAWPSFVTKIKISNFETGKQDEEHMYLVYSRGSEKVYVDFQSPQEKGRHLLMLGDDMWIYLPDTSRAVRITPLQRLTGNASNGDVARTNYANDYDATYLRKETVDGVECHVLQLEAKRKGATYHKIDYWIRADTARPVKADLFVISGKMIKSTSFSAEIPALSLQTLVENSVKYAVAAHLDGANIRVSARSQAGILRLEVSDDGPGFTPQAIRPGHGLANLEGRLAALFGGAARLEIDRTDGLTAVRLSLPRSPLPAAV